MKRITAMEGLNKEFAYAREQLEGLASHAEVEGTEDYQEEIDAWENEIELIEDALAQMTVQTPTERIPK